MDPSLSISPSALDELPSGVALVRLDVPGNAASFSLQYSNARFHALLGRDLAALRGKHIATAVPEIAHMGLLERCMEALRTQRSLACEALVLAAGSTARCPTRAIPLNGEVVMLLVEDGRPPKQETAALPELDQHSKWLLEASPDAMVIVDAEGIIQLVNENTERLFGYSKREMLGQPVEMLMPLASHSKHGEHLKHFAQDPQRRMMGHGRELLGRRKDGSEFPVEIALSPLETASGSLVSATVRDITLRRTAQEAQQHLEAILVSSQDAIISKDLDGLITAWNPGAQEVFGHGAEDMIGKPIFLLVPANMQVVERAVESTVVDHGQVQSFETMRLRKDGTLVDVYVTVSPIRDDRGTIMGSSDTSRVITARKNAERELRELNRTLEQRIVNRTEDLIASQRRYHDTLDKMMEGVQFIDAAYRYTYVNDALVAQSTLTRAQLLGRSMLEVFPGIERTVLFGVLQECMADRTARTLDNDFSFPDGRERTFQLSIQPMADGIFILSTDITERKHGEEALRASEARYHNALDVLMEGAQIIGYDLRHLYVNEAMAALSTFSKEELLGTTIMERYPGVEETDLFKELERCMVERCTHTMETEFTFPNGTTKSLYLRIQPADEGLFILSQDITERKRVELELAAQRQQLKEQNEELEQFTYIASHDLQEPLRMVTSYVQLLQRRYGEKLDSDAQEFIEFAVDGAQRMKQLIDDLLSYSRVGRSAALHTVDMNTVVQEVRANLGSAIAESGAKFHIEELPRVHASPTDMMQVMQNLIGNAVKFRRMNAVPEVWVKGREEATQWCFEVIDNGIGIEPTYGDKIFAPFKRLNDRSKYAGSGIGLAIAEKIVQRYGGRIWYTSVPGEGSNFKFTIERERA